MPESIDWPRMHPTRSRRRFFFLILAVLAVIVIGGRTALSYYVDVLWFESLGYGDVFWKTLGLQWGIFAAFAADRKSTRLNSSHVEISYAVFCLKKKTRRNRSTRQLC